MKFESLAADLQAWLRDSIARGCTPETIDQSLRAAGYSAGFARQAVEAAFARLAPQAAARGAEETAPAQQEEGQPDAHSILAESPNTIETSDRPVHILMALNAPRIVLFGNLLAPEECDALIEMARP
ncbi:MAG: 2-oxoglutarate-dependent dioxygenase, partial [Burkholderiaceae bacterium]|nr:2-oxoglutarate-dependent dioxygenase [Burkholderiaceae bacterium]